MNGIKGGRPQVNSEGQGTVGIGNGSAVHRIDDNDDYAVRLKRSSWENHKTGESSVCCMGVESSMQLRF